MTSTTPNVSADFISGPIADLGVSVTRTPVTTTINNISGQKTYADGTPETITVVWNNPSPNYNLDKSGETKIADGIMYVQSTQTINKRDKITYNGNLYRVDKISERLMDTNTGFKKITLFLI